MSKVVMTEKAYIIATDLAKLRSITKLVYDIVPAVDECIDPDEYRQVQVFLNKWEMALEKSFECIGEG